MTHDYQRGIEVIKKYLAGLPASPGVYRMLDAAGNALYVGKAKHLRNRVTSYTSASGLTNRILKMISLTASMEIITTRSESEALLIEANLIKRLAPRYNILLKDDKSFPYIMMTGDHPFARIVKHRGSQNRKGTYFGPFASAGAVNQTIALLQRAFLLRPCSDSVFKQRTRPCLQYQIKRCSAPCVGYISQAEYAALAVQASDFLRGKNREVQESLSAEMQRAAEATEYEKAALLRDRIRALTQVQGEQKIHAAHTPYADVIGLYRAGSESCIQIFFFRAGQNFGNKAYFPTNTEEASDSEILAQFISQFYQAHTPPRQIIVSHAPEEAALLAEALQQSAGSKVEILHPQKGEKRDLLTKVVSNARHALERREIESLSDRNVREELGKLLGLEAAPERIEVYDNSHIMGTNAVGAMIVAGAEGFIKHAYRQFNMENISIAPDKKPDTALTRRTSLTRSDSFPLPVGEGQGEGTACPKHYINAGDDYGMLRHMLTRRLSRLQKEEGDSPRPDLLLIDGGAGQLTVTSEVMAELGISDIPYVAIAKGVDRNAGREWFHLSGREPFQLPVGSPVLHYLQRLRDEAHRFAIGTHRNKRSRSLTRSELDDVPNIGATRKKALLAHFGSARDVKNASIEALSDVPGISRKTAEQIYAFFH